MAGIWTTNLKLKTANDVGSQSMLPTAPPFTNELAKCLSPIIGTTEDVNNKPLLQTSWNHADAPEPLEKGSPIGPQSDPKDVQTFHTHHLLHPKQYRRRQSKIRPNNSPKHFGTPETKSNSRLPKPEADTEEIVRIYPRNQLSSMMHIGGALHTLHDVPVNAYHSGRDAVVVVTLPVIKSTKSFMESFKTFIESRKVVDVAVAFVMAFSFRAVCLSMMSDLIGPLLGLIIPISGHKLSERFFVIKRTVKNETDQQYKTRQQAKDDGAITVNWGHFVQVNFDFMLLCLALYLFINCFFLKLISTAAVICACPYCKENTREGASHCPHCAQVIGDMEDVTRKESQHVIPRHGSAGSD